ncbi:pyridoxal phosphate-dependent transferase [Chaetomium sp. MPI-CAGE-AT-0009]|nr:pyridoxal phosphate-dependent transferase [Chaetomium sp. MPI-CAGE-AT-0009]
MRGEVVKSMNKSTTVDPVLHFTYGSGPKGSPRLRQSLASFLNSNVRPREPVRQEDILILTGMTGVIDSLAWSICNEGEGIIIPQPFYPGFAMDIPTRARAVIVPASFQTLEGYKGFDHVFDPDMNVKALEKPLRGAEEKGIKVWAVLLTNPHNPLRRCSRIGTLPVISEQQISGAWRINMLLQHGF